MPVPTTPKSFFICGTDTGVGKTTVAALLLCLLREAGIAAAPMKPLATGCPLRHGVRIAADLDFCLAAAGMTPGALEKEYMAPYRFALPASPHLAARHERRRIDFAVIRRAAARLTACYRPLLIEGAGGLMVPLRGSWLLLDLVRQLRVPVILVARSGLGTINHTLLTLSALAGSAVPVAGIVFNDGPDDDPRVAADNVRCIPRLGGTHCLARIPYRRDIERLLADGGRNPALLESLLPRRQLLVKKVLRHVC